MIGTGAAILAATAASAAGGYLASKKQASAAKAAGEATAAATDKSVAEQRRQFDTARSDTQPYREIGVNALARLAGEYGLNVTQTPGSVQRRTDYISPPAAPAPAPAPAPASYALGPADIELARRRLAQMESSSAGQDAFVDAYSDYKRLPDARITELVKARGVPGFESGAVPSVAQPAAQPAALDTAQNPDGSYSTLPTPEYTVTSSGQSPLEASQATYNRLASGFQESPGYQFRLNEGLDAITRQSRALGVANSGRALRAITDYAQGTASQEFGNYYNRAASQYDSYINRLAAIAGIGQTSTAQTVAAGQQTAGNISNLTMQGGQLQSNAINNVGAAQAMPFVTAANAVNNGVSNYLFYNALNKGQFAPNITGTVG